MEQSYINVLDKYLFGVAYTNNLHRPCRETKHLIIIRICCLVYLTAIYIWSLVLMDNIEDNVIYLTMESYFLTWVYFALTVEDYFANTKQKPEYFKGLWKLCSIIYEMAYCLELPVTIVFWGFLFRVILTLPGVTPQIIALNANLHAGPFICLTIDFCFNSIQFPPRHYWVVFIFGGLYMIFNMIYSLAYSPIYRPIDWVSILSYVIVLGSFLSSYGVHVLARYLNKKYKKLSNEVKDQKSQDQYHKLDQEKKTEQKIEILV